VRVSDPFWIRGATAAEVSRFGLLDPDQRAVPAGRNACPQELQEAITAWRALRAYQGLETEARYEFHGQLWMAHVVTYWTCESRQGFYTAFEFRSSDGTRRREPLFCQTANYRTMLEIVRELSVLTGPLLVCPLDYPGPVVIEPGVDVRGIDLCEAGFMTGDDD
jgi:hypothetical protein